MLCIMNDFWKENDQDGSQGDLRALGHPQRPRQAQLRRVQQVPVMIIKIWHGTCLYAIFQTQIDLKRWGCPRASWSPYMTLGLFLIDLSEKFSSIYFHNMIKIV